MNNKKFIIDYVKNSKKHSRNEELECENGFKSKNYIHKSKKIYDRKQVKKTNTQ